MLESQCVFDVETDIIARLEKLFGLDEKEVGELNVRIVGQERDGCLLYTWSGPIPHPSGGIDSSCKVTQVGLYDPVNKLNKTLFVHEKLVDIVSCTVSQEQTFIGFVTLDQTVISEGYGRRQKQDKYQAYLAEVASPSGANRVFYLNLERPHYIRLQFLYGKYHGQVTRRESHLLVLLYGESIGLYHIPIARVGEDGVILSGEPKKEQIFQKRFVWWQWDPTYQRLYVAQFRRQSKSASNSQYKCFLTGYQFTEATMNEFMLDIPLDIPIPYKKSNSNQRYHYQSPGPHQCIPDCTINMIVLTQNNGTMCICFQHPQPSSKMDPQSQDNMRKMHQGIQASTPTSPAPPSEDVPTTLKYSVILVHHGKTSACSALHIPSTVIRKCRLLFVLVGDYLVVHLDGYFTHLLLVGVDFEPCHHILWQDPKSMGIDSSPLKSHPIPKTFITFGWNRQSTLQSVGALVYDTQTQKGLRIGFSREELLSFFTRSTSQSTRLAILHFSVIHQRDLAFTKKLVDCILSDPTSLEMAGFMDEFLVGCTYTALRRQTETYIMRYIPFTCSPSFRGQTQIDLDGNRVYSLSYSALGSVTLGSLSKVNSDHNTAEMWGNLENAYNFYTTTKRFSSRQVPQCIDAAEADPDFVRVPLADPPNLFQKLASAAKSALTAGWSGTSSSPASKSGIQHQPSRSEIVLGSPPSFLSMTPPTPPNGQEQLISVTSDLLITHLRKYLKRDSRSKLRCVAQEYIECQMQQSILLAHILCRLIDPTDTPSKATLETPATQKELDLFNILERYDLALQQQGFPVPPGFPLYYITLAFRCLRFSTFKQYVENQVLMPTQEFVEKMLKELPGSEEYSSMKLYVLQQLPPEAGIACAKQWSHPMSRRFLAIHYTDACLSDGKKEEFAPVYQTEENHRGKDDTLDGQTPHGIGFPPLSTLIGAMERKVARQTERNKEAQPLDQLFLWETSLAQLYSTGCQLDDIITYG